MSSDADRLGLPLRHRIWSARAYATAILILSIALFGVALMNGVAANSELLRPLPFPFTSMVTFSSDADSQTPWHAVALHKVLNERLGLPISESLFVLSAAGDPAEMALFRNHADINDSSSRVDGHTVAGLLLREWHRGNLDQFHTWYSDYVPQLLYRLAEPASPSQVGTPVPLPPSTWMHFYFSWKNRGIQQLRLFFDREPPSDLQILFRFRAGEILIADERLVRRGRQVQAQTRSGAPVIVGLVLDATSDVGVTLPPGVDSKDLVEIVLRAASCAAGCAAS